MSTIPIPNSRCLFLELPPELRIQIYELLASTRSYRKWSGKTVQVSNNSKTTNKWFAKKTPITWVNRQIRGESLSIIYANAEIWVWTATAEHWESICYWARHVADSAMLSSVKRICFFSLDFCACTIDIEQDSAGLLVANVGTSWTCDSSTELEKCGSQGEFRELAESKLENLDVDKDGWQLMTKDVTREIVSAFCEVAKRGRF